MTMKQTENSSDQKEKQQEEKKKNVDDNFIPPDGGWGWMIVVAAGFSNFCILPVLQCFGLIFKDRFEELGINSSQTTTLLNINCAVMSCIGLANGPLFRRFSYRQVAFTGAAVCAFSITVLSTMKTFTGALIFFSILYAAGMGIAMSSNALALNTYFKEKRRIATGLSWTCTGMGPIIMPHIITMLMVKFGMEGTVLIYGGFAFNAVACALLLQPVSRHVQKPSPGKTLKSAGATMFTELPKDKEGSELKELGLSNGYKGNSLENVADNTKIASGTLERAKRKFGSQYLYYDDEEDGATGIDVIGPGTPMMSRANDGWFSRRNTSSTSLASKSSRKEAVKNHSRRPSVNLNKAPSLLGLNRGPSNDAVDTSRKKVSGLQPTPVSLVILSESCEHAEEVCKDTACVQKREPVTVPEQPEAERLIEGKTVEIEEREQSLAKKALEAVIIFFDLDLFRDPVYVNLMLGITFANFAELNFSLLTPFILSEYGFSKMQVATVMSVLGGVDVITRLTIPFIASFIGWQNRTFFLVGILIIAAGRIVLAHVGNFGITIAVAVVIGIGKALRTIFMALVIPTHVPLSRLPGATGIQLLFSGIVSLGLGPIVGWIRDTTGDYSMMLHSINIFTYLTVISWIVEIQLTKRRARKLAAESPGNA